MGIDGNEAADQLGRQSSSHLHTDPKSTLGISAKVARGVFRNCTGRGHEEHWLSAHGQKPAKSCLKRPSAKKAGELFNLSRNQIRMMTGLLIGQCHSKGHLFKLGLVNNSKCRHLKRPETFFLTVGLWPH
jgi:hypothetical protein